MVMIMAEASLSASGEDPFLEVKAISRVLSSEATRGSDGLEETFQNSPSATQFLRTLSIPRTDQTKAHVRQRAVQPGETKKHLIGELPGGRPRSATCVCQVQGSVPVPVRTPQRTPHKSPRKSLLKSKGEGLEFNCSCKRHGERYQQGNWSGEEWESNSFATKKAGACKCVAGAVVDCTAVCCCPLSLLHLLALACIKLPSIVVIRVLRKAKTKLRKKQKCQEANEHNIGPTTPFTPSLSCQESTSDVSWAPDSGFGDHRMWQEYFGGEEISLADH